jgi:adenosylcobyric acid synthase
MSAPVVMVLGTASSVGKSTLVTALCRIAARRGIRVAPFKAQNMSNNAAVTADGGEIARSIAVQAAAAGIEPDVRMNPILLKPEGQRRSQVVVEGRPWQTLDTMDYWERKLALWQVVTRNLDAVRADYDLVIAEGAGSPVELNLKAGDIVNMRVARYAQARTLLVGDIDVGGIFAALLGTLMLLDDDERALIRGLIVNRFRGDPSLFSDGIRILEQRSRLPVLGLIPWLDNIGLAEEDAVALERPRHCGAGGIVIAVIQIPAIANFDDFDPLAREAGIELRYIDRPEALADAAAAILPGTKHTLAARRWLHERGFDEALNRFSGAVVGLCGGYQLLGTHISDPLGVEGEGGDAPGIGLLPISTVFAADKRTVRVEGLSHAPWAAGTHWTGYEIHMGRTIAETGTPALLSITRRGQQLCAEIDGSWSDNGHVWGCYIHGIFANDAFRRGWLKTLGWRDHSIAPPPDHYERLANHAEVHLDPQQLDGLLAIH